MYLLGVIKGAKGIGCLAVSGSEVMELQQQAPVIAKLKLALHKDRIGRGYLRRGTE